MPHFHTRIISSFNSDCKDTHFMWNNNKKDVEHLMFLIFLSCRMSPDTLPFYHNNRMNKNTTNKKEESNRNQQ